MGVMTTSAKLRKITWDDLRPAAEQMATLNAAAAEAMGAVDFHACTDVTGFGLVGHGRNVAHASELTLRIPLSGVPVFDGAEELAQKGWFSGGAKRGRAGLADQVSIASGLPEHRVNLVFDAETSGGLLIIVPPTAANALESELAERGLPVVRVGEFVPRERATIELV